MLTDTGGEAGDDVGNIYCYNYCCRPEYGHHGHHGGPPGGVEDKWRHTYPYVPTSYYYNNPNPPRQNPESIGD